MLLALMPLFFGERFGLVVVVVASREARKASNPVKSPGYTNDAQCNIGYPSGRSLLDLLACVLGKGHRGICSFVKHKVKINLKMQKVGDLNMRVRQRWCASVPLSERQRAGSRQLLIESLQV